MKKIILISALFAFHVGFVAGQTSLLDFQRHIISSFHHQLSVYPQEKAYLHLDRNHYLAGDTVWFRGYVVNACSHIPDSSSRYLYVNLQDPADSVVQQICIRQTQGIYQGYFALPANMPQGHYTVWAYTMFMRNAGPDYFFQAPIRISEPRAAEIQLLTDYHRNPGSDTLHVKLELQHYLDGRDYGLSEIRTGLKEAGQVWSAERVKNGQYPVNEYLRYRKKETSGIFPMSFADIDTTKRQVLLVNYEESYRFVEMPPLVNDFQVSFYPEGGNLLANTLNVIAFKAMNAYGQAEDITGEFFDEQGTKLGDILPLYKGMGTVSLFPNAGQTYYAICTDRNGYTKRFDFPTVQDRAVGLQITDRNDRLFVVINRPQSLPGFDSLSLVIHSRGKVIFAGSLEDGSKPFLLDKSLFPTGVAHFLLLDFRQNILSERLVFIYHEDTPRISLLTDKSTYGVREPVQVSVQISDAADQPVNTNFSVAVTDDLDVLPDSTRNIYTDLLLSSDLRGFIDSPAWYFVQKEEHRMRALDALLLTQGWRRYDMPQFMQGKVDLPRYPLEIGRYISGRVKALRSEKPSVGTPVSMVLTRSKYMDVTDTDEQGRFSFSGFEIREGDGVFIQALSQKGRNNVEMLLDDEFPFIRFPGIPGWSAQSVSRENDFNYLTKGDQRWIIKNGVRTINMAPIEIKSRKEKWWEDFYAEIVDFRYEKDYLEKMEIKSFLELILEHPQIRMRYYPEDCSMRLSTSYGPVVFRIQDKKPPSEFNWHTDIDMDQVERIDFIIGPKAQAFKMGAGGAILITTKHGRPYFNVNPYTFNRRTINAIGVQTPAEFYSPKYDRKETNQGHLPDLRTTIYWNPAIETDSMGKASFQFYTADQNPTTYSVVVEGITSDGRIVRSVANIDCR